MTKRIALAYLADFPGMSRGAWRHPEVDPANATDLEAWEKLAQTAERGFFDLFFKADNPGTRNDGMETYAQSPFFFYPLEPLTLISALARSTEHIGLGGTVSTSFFEPANIARIFASLDHLTRGRAAWNIVTTANDYAARNFGLDRLPPRDQRYAQAKESYDIVTSYWDTWEDDAFIHDKTNARYFDPKRFHNTNFDGEFFKVQGGISIPRPPQGHPVIIQAGASETGKNFAAETAEIVFGTGSSFEGAKDFYDDLKERVTHFGRTADSMKILSGVEVVVGETEEAAREKQEEFEALVPIDIQVRVVSEDLETDLSDLPLDQPIPVERVPKESNHHQQYFNEIVALIEKGMTLREVAKTYKSSSTTIIGSPKQVADHMQEWIEGGAGDGFMVRGLWNPGNLEDFVDMVIPELQGRGMVRTAYEGRTLRENLGLARPANRHAK
ncbi:NtaA/DmoA family FMN-dependent monooxygenase [Nesterenkonia muleiensis]|uniref:NtaA/DmoA family FMN-dependent monooxygenase n=1 Tax=Nesterenkonia muleiensis TaxID=2282648 RepID=UPI000E74BC5D|nr:NtaA/DmoA family FMN-dependent monooxygenase [Nesterenkonia muleiensis]